MDFDGFANFHFSLLFARAEAKKSHDALDYVALTRVNNEMPPSASTALKNLSHIRVWGWKGTVLVLMTREIFLRTSTAAPPNSTNDEHEGNYTMDDCHRCCCKSSQRSNGIHHSRELWCQLFRKIWPSDQSPRTHGGLSRRGGCVNKKGLKQRLLVSHLPPTGKIV